VMGAHGRNVLNRLLLGSLTESMLREVSVPIMTVAHLNPSKEVRDAKPVPLRHILYATELGNGAETGLRVSAELARGTGARLTVLHVLTVPEMMYYGAEGGYLPEQLAKLREEQTGLRALLQNECLMGVDVAPLITEGNVSREILRVARETDAD